MSFKNKTLYHNDMPNAVQPSKTWVLKAKLYITTLLHMPNVFQLSNKKINYIMQSHAKCNYPKCKIIIDKGKCSLKLYIQTVKYVQNLFLTWTIKVNIYI